MLRTRLVRFINQPALRRLPSHELASLVRAILLYSLGRRNSEQLRQLALQCQVTDELYEFKSDFLDRTYSMAALFWRSVFEYFKRLKTKTADGPETVELSVETLRQAVAAIKTLKPELQHECAGDVMLLQAFLPLDDHRELYRLARATTWATPSDYDLLPIVANLQRYCSALVRRRMRFIIKHDNGLTAEDLEGALFEAGLMTLRQYDAEQNGLKLLNTAKRGAHNYFVRLVEFYTARRRSRLVRHIDGDTTPYELRNCGTCAWLDVKGSDGKTCHQAGVQPVHQPCRRRDVGNLYHARAITELHECGNCLYYDRPIPGKQNGTCSAQNRLPSDPICGEFLLRVGVEQYVATTASLDAPVGDKNQEDRATLIDLLPAEPKEPAVDEWLETLLASLPPLHARVVNITLGGGDEAFDQWLWSRTYQFSSEFTDQQLARYGCEFVGIDVDEVRDALRHHLTARRAARNL